MANEKPEEQGSDGQEALGVPDWMASMDSPGDIPKGTESQDEPQEEVAAEEEYEGEPAPEPEPGGEPEKRMYQVKVDGEESEVDEEELIRGYQTEKSTTQKAMAIANERRRYEKYGPVIDYLESPVRGEEAFNLLLDHMRGMQAQAQPQPGQAAPAALNLDTLPAEYREQLEKDPMWSQVIKTVNAQAQEIQRLGGDVSGIEQQREQQTRAAEFQQKMQGRFHEARKQLEDKLGTTLDPLEFDKRVQQHVEGRGIAPEDAGMFILRDPQWLASEAERAFAEEITKANEGKAAETREQRAKQSAKPKTLKNKKSASVPTSPSLPTKKDGSVDSEAHVGMHPGWFPK
jgi:hypothetical protein